MLLKGEIHEPTASFRSTAGDDDIHGSTRFDIPKNIIILIYFEKFLLTGVLDYSSPDQWVGLR